MNHLIYILSYLIFQILITVINGSLTCRDENGNAVDWFYLYKLPDEKVIKGVEDGLSYMYITSETASKGWITAKNLINESKSIPGLTLDPLYKQKSDSLWILYNDQPPEGSDVSRRGHTKGVIGADKDGGFWLVHSVPNFPPSPDSNAYSYPESGIRNGQSFLCITLTADEIDQVGTQLQYNQISAYWDYVSEDLNEHYPNLAAAAKGKIIRRAPWNNAIIITSAGGDEFHSFAKAASFKKDLYEDWVAPALETSLLAETWLNGRGALPSNCTRKYKVNNVDKIQLCQISECTSFTSTKDHSKWAVSTTKNNPWLCVGDINRAKSQETRGGGTVCLKNSQVWQSYYKSVASIQPCTRNRGLFDKASVIMI